MNPSPEFNPEKKEKEIDMAAFRQEIKSLTADLARTRVEYQAFNKNKKSEDDNLRDSEIEKMWYQRGGKPFGMLELDEVNPEDLTPEDAEMWYKINNYKAGSITPAQFKEYGDGVKKTNNSSRINFQAVVANRIGPLWMSVG